jgi:hypothetical protein
MCCLTCAYFDPIEPEAHKIARESGQCEAHCGREWDWYTAFRYIQSHEEPLHGICRHNPVNVSKPSWGVCGQHKPVLSPDNGWGVRAFGRDSDHSLLDWARKQYLNIKRGPENRREQELLEQQNRELRRQLAIARKRSASRLAKLQKGAKPKSVEPNVLPEPQLRLVVNG